MKNITIYAAVLLTILASCDKASQLSSEYSTDPDAVRIDASVGAITRSNPLGSAEEQTKFNAGDKISVNHVSAKKVVNYVYDGSSWAPEGEDYLTWQTEGTNTFRLQYPYIGYESDFGEYFKDQSTLEKMTRSDLMQSEDIEHPKIPDDKRLTATLIRQRSLVTVKIVRFNDEFGDDAKITDLKLHLWDGGQGEEIITVTPLIRDAQGAAQPAGTAGLKGYSYTAIGRNDCNYKDYTGQNVPFITMTVAGKTLTVSNPPEMVVGKHYTYNLKVGKETVKIAGVTVAPWGAGEPIDGDYETVTDRYSVWDGTSVDTALEGYGYEEYGYGTEEYPYVINTAAHLAGFAKLVNDGVSFSGKYIKLDANIDLNGQPWTPIGKGKSFRGHFNGNGKVIINMTVTASAGDDCAGFFGEASDATISNLILRNGKVSGEIKYWAALLVAFGADITVESCKVDGTVKSDVKNVYSGGLIGAIIGKNKISNCEVNVDCCGRYSGGIIGKGEFNNDGNITIEGCTVRGVVSSGYGTVGGIAGFFRYGVPKISDCQSYADVKCGNMSRESSMGGLVAEMEHSNDAIVKNCAVYGSISCKPYGGNECHVGGMFGKVRVATISGLKFEGYMDVDKDCNSTTDIEYTGYFIGKIDNSITVADKCTYRKAGTKDLKAVASYPEGVDITRIEEAN